MKKIITVLSLFAIILSSLPTTAQGPWDNDLKIAFSNDGTTFGESKLFLDSADVPSVAMLDDGTLIAAFQWFHGTTDGVVAIRKSTDNGFSWTGPTKANFINQPQGLYVPVDPTVVNIGGGQIRMYFSIGTSMITDSTLDVYSATSSDGINYTFDSNSAAYSDSVEIIEPAVGLINGTWHCMYAHGGPWEGSRHATSPGGITFSPATHINSDTAHTWIGNIMTEGNTAKFYGSEVAIWWASTTDGVSWSSYNSTNILGGSNPAVTKMADSTYVMIYVKRNAPVITGTKELGSNVRLYPNPTSSEFTIESTIALENAELSIYNNLGQKVAGVNNITGNTIIFNRNELKSGVYIIKLTQDDHVILNKKVVFTEL